MRRTIPLGLLLVACTSSTPEPAKPVEAHPQTGVCAEQIAMYISTREQLSRCETDSDCAEMPGLCPYGPYYIHRDAPIEPVLALERELMTNCHIPECERPMELGIAHCEQGTCARGRKSEKPRRRARGYGKGIRYMSCWDGRETWLEADGVAKATASSILNGVTPLVAISPAVAGTLVLEIDWPTPCAGCKLLISEHNSGMANPITPTATRTDTEHDGAPIVRERLEFPVAPGPYWFAGMADIDTNFTIRADLRDAQGERGRVTRHGVSWQHMCEG